MKPTPDQTRVVWVPRNMHAFPEHDISAAEAELAVLDQQFGVGFYAIKDISPEYGVLRVTFERVADEETVRAYVASQHARLAETYAEVVGGLPMPPLTPPFSIPEAE